MTNGVHEIRMMDGRLVRVREIEATRKKRRIPDWVKYLCCLGVGIHGFVFAGSACRAIHRNDLETGAIITLVVVGAALIFSSLALLPKGSR